MQARHRRRPPRTETERQQAVAACAAHLRDLKRVHGRPPADVKLKSVAIPQRLSGPPVASYCTSPAATLRGAGAMTAKPKPRRSKAKDRSRAGAARRHAGAARQG